MLSQKSMFFVKTGTRGKLVELIAGTKFEYRSTTVL